MNKRNKRTFSFLILITLVAGILGIWLVKYVRLHNAVSSCEDAGSAIISGSGLQRFTLMLPNRVRATPKQVELFQKYVLGSELAGLKFHDKSKVLGWNNGNYTLILAFFRNGKYSKSVGLSCSVAPDIPRIDLMTILRSIWMPHFRPGQKSIIPGEIEMGMYRGIERDNVLLMLN